MRSVFLTAVLLTTITVIGAQRPTVSRRQPAGVEFRPPIVLQPILHPLARSSGQIFAGTVLEVKHDSSGSSGAVTTTSIRFRVEEAIRGVRKGQVVEIKEWGGLWQAGERYRRGERVLLFLYPPSRLGLTSPVGHAGRFSVDSAGHVILKSGFVRAPIGIRKFVMAIRKAETK
ncbi:MAG TPA: hypothetical protein VH596_18660 [Terriglobales bacterium]